MKRVTLNIIFMKTWKMVTLCTSKTIGAHLKTVLKDKIVIEDNKLISIFGINNSKKICWFILDNKNNLLSINDKVPKKMNVLGINLDILKNVLLNYNDTLESMKLNTYLKEEYGIELIPGLKDIEKKEEIKEETVEVVVKPAIVIEKEEELEVVLKEDKKKVKKEEEPKTPKKEEPKKEPKQKEKEKKEEKKAEPKTEPIIPKKDEKPKTSKTEEPKIVEKTEEPKKVEKPKENKKDKSKKEEIKVEPKKKDEDKELEKKKKLLEEKKKELEKKKKELEKSKKLPLQEKPSEVKLTLNITNNDTSSLTVETNDTKTPEARQKEEPKKEPEKQGQRVTFTIVGPDGRVLYSNVITNDMPLSVMDILLKTGLPLNIEFGNFITSINGINNTNYVPGSNNNSGWVYEVNNAKVNLASNEYIAKENDSIVWKYVNLDKFFVSEEPELTEEESIGGKTR